MSIFINQRKSALLKTDLISKQNKFSYCVLCFSFGCLALWESFSKLRIQKLPIPNNLSPFPNDSFSKHIRLFAHNMKVLNQTWGCCHPTIRENAPNKLQTKAKGECVDTRSVEFGAIWNQIDSGSTLLRIRLTLVFFNCRVSAPLGRLVMN